ncbi:MAG: hypothetical protein HY078_04975 [Elusimicrobia bacterium]|nr:hypothetical protein [Elusimicrobiota bacterium]
MPTKNLPPIKPREQAVAIYKKEQSRKKGLFSSLLSRIGALFGRGAGAGAPPTFTAATGGGSLLQTVSSQGLLFTIASSKAGFFAVGLGVMAAAVVIGVVATQWKNWTTASPAMPQTSQQPAAPAFASTKDAPTRPQIKGAQAGSRESTTPGGISSLNYLKMPGTETVAAPEDTGTAAAPSSENYASVIKEAKARGGKPKAEAGKEPAKPQISAMKGSVSPSLSGKGGGGSGGGGRLLSAQKGAYSADKGGGGGSAPNGYKNGVKVGMRDPVRKGSLHAGKNISIPMKGALSQAFGARADNFRAMHNSGQGTSQAAGSTYDGGGRRSMLGNSRATSASGNLDSKNVSVNGPEPKEELPTPPPLGKTKNESPWQNAIMAAMGLLSLMKMLMGMAKQQKAAAKANPDPNSRMQQEQLAEQLEQQGIEKGLEGQALTDYIENGMNQPGATGTLGESLGGSSPNSGAGGENLKGLEMPSMPPMPPPSGGGDNSPQYTPPKKEEKEEPQPISVSRNDNGMPHGGGGGGATPGADGIMVDPGKTQTIGTASGGTVEMPDGPAANSVV